MVKIIVLDIDGTILDFNGNMSEKFISYINKLSEKNKCITAILSGRNRKDIVEIIKKHNLKDIKYISSFERYLYKKNGNKYEPLIEYNDFVHNLFLDVRDNISNLLQEFKNEYNIKNCVLDTYSDIAYSIKFDTEEDARKYHSLYDEYIKKNYYNVPVISLRNRIYLTARNINTGKGAVLKKIVELEKNVLHNVLAIGDSHNDYDMLEIPEIMKGCPANAEDIIKKLIAQNNGYISNKSFSEGTQDIIEHFYT